MADDSLDPTKYTVYWFARDLIDSDEFGSFARRETEPLRGLATALEERLERGDDVETLREIIRERITGVVSRTYGEDISKRYRQTEDLAERISRRIESRTDVAGFVIAAEAVVRTTEIMDETPSFEEEEVHRIVDETLETDDEELDPERAFDALYAVDVDGEAYQLGAQREPLIEYVNELLDELRNDRNRDDADVARILSGIVQEYERRVGQSRSSTAGNVLETGLQRVFERFGVPATGVPEHFGDLEVDNIVEGSDGVVGFSCKRTLRERFKQSLSRQSEIGVDEIWFVSLLMGDVSLEKLRIIAEDGGRLYVPRDSFVWKRYGDDDGLADALRPASEFLTDVEAFTGCSLDTARTTRP